jgi:hypothetical protein
MAEQADRANQTTYMINNDCPAHVFLNGELKNAARNNHYSDEGSYALVFNADGGVDLQFFNAQAEPTVAVRIRVLGSPKSTFGCYMNIQICLPLNEPAMLNKTIGLLGTPNGNREDEWKSESGEIFPIASSGKAQYTYCTSYHCVMTMHDSLFIYEGKSFQELYSCSAEYPGEPDLTQATPAILAICNGNQNCILEGMLGGEEEARANNEQEKEIDAVAINNDVVVEGLEFDIEPVRTTSVLFR